MLWHTVADCARRPAGRNIHALDPYRMPSPAALERGSRVAQGIIEAHQAANNGAFPETVAVSVESAKVICRGMCCVWVSSILPSL